MRSRGRRLGGHPTKSQHLEVRLPALCEERLECFEQAFSCNCFVSRSLSFSPPFSEERGFESVRPPVYQPAVCPAVRSTSPDLILRTSSRMSSVPEARPEEKACRRALPRGRWTRGKRQRRAGSAHSSSPMRGSPFRSLSAASMMSASERQMRGFVRPE